MPKVLSIDAIHAALKNQISPEALVKLFESIPTTHRDERYGSFRGLILQHQHFPLGKLESLPKGDKQATRAMARRDWDGSVECLTQLSFSEDQLTRAYLAANPRTPVDVLKRLATDESRLVRSALGNRKDARRLSFPKVQPVSPRELMEIAGY